ncbi:MAG: alpha/beta hydrolase family protein [Acidimicrobiia bacterium]
MNTFLVGGVPVALWLPVRADNESVPLVLFGHGGTHHKTHEAVVAKAERLVAQCGAAVAVIDGPVHGERLLSGDPDDRETVWAAYQAYLASKDKGVLASEVVADWQKVIDALVERPDIDATRIGYWGLSMGSRFGIPLLAAESRIKVAVIGLIGTNAGPYIAEAAKAITIPLRCIDNLDDELFPIAGGYELFNALASPDKRLTVVPGAHGDIPDDELDRLYAFLEDGLA